MSELVRSLTTEQDVEASLRPEPTLEAFRAALERGYVHLRFPATRGGTELGVKLNPEGSELTHGDLEKGTGHVFIVGELTLDYIPVRLYAKLELATLRGVGHVEPIAE